MLYACLKLCRGGRRGMYFKFVNAEMGRGFIRNKVYISWIKVHIFNKFSYESPTRVRGAMLTLTATMYLEFLNLQIIARCGSSSQVTKAPCCSTRSKEFYLRIFSPTGKMLWDPEFWKTKCDESCQEWVVCSGVNISLIYNFNGKSGIISD